MATVPLPPTPRCTVDRLDQLRAGRAAHAADRTAFEERRRFGLPARHAAKLAHWATQANEEKEDPTPEPTPPEDAAPDVA